MILTEIKETEWKEFSEIETEPNTPYWFKMANGNVVLAIWVKTNYCTGWAKAFFDDNFTLKCSHNSFYMLKGAKLQCALKN